MNDNPYAPPPNDPVEHKGDEAAASEFLGRVALALMFLLVAGVHSTWRVAKEAGREEGLNELTQLESYVDHLEDVADRYSDELDKIEKNHPGIRAELLTTKE